MATDHGNHVTKFVGLRGQIGDVDPCTVHLVLDKSHSSFSMGGARYNRDNPAWFSVFASSANANATKVISGKPNFLYHAVNYPDITTGARELLQGATSERVDLGWVHRQAGTGWMDIERRTGGIIYPACSKDRNDTKFIIENVTAAEWFSNEVSRSGNDYNRIINVHGDYTGSIPYHLAGGFLRFKTHASFYESGGWSANTVNFLGNIDITIENTQTGYSDSRMSVVAGQSDDIQTHVNVFGNFKLNGSGPRCYLTFQAARGHAQINIMPGGVLTLTGTARACNDRHSSVMAWGDGKVHGTVV